MEWGNKHLTSRDFITSIYPPIFSFFLRLTAVIRGKWPLGGPLQWKFAFLFLVLFILRPKSWCLLSGHNASPYFLLYVWRKPQNQPRRDCGLVRKLNVHSKTTWPSQKWKTLAGSTSFSKIHRTETSFLSQKPTL